MLLYTKIYSKKVFSDTGGDYNPYRNTILTSYSEKYFENMCCDLLCTIKVRQKALLRSSKRKLGESVLRFSCTLEVNQKAIVCSLTFKFVFEAVFRVLLCTSKYMEICDLLTIIQIVLIWSIVYRMISYDITLTDNFMAHNCLKVQLDAKMSNP